MTPRIIPTYVGSTKSVASYSICRTESFPRMWDQLLQILLSFLHPRIIPTYVGSTKFGQVHPLQIPNHSHVCGINRTRTNCAARRFESFPRMWDQQYLPDAFRNAIRIIPTYVGSTSTARASRCFTANHSHVCGINPLFPSCCPAAFESFPRMWDQQSPKTCHPTMNRIIPTYVGSTPTVRMLSAYHPNHSHVCGINMGAVR